MTTSKKNNTSKKTGGKKVSKKKEDQTLPAGDVQILGVKTNEDGTSDVDIEIDDKFIENYKIKTGKTKVTEAELIEYFGKLIDEAVKDLENEAKPK